MQRIVGLRAKGKRKRNQGSSNWQKSGSGNRSTGQSGDKADPAICCIHGNHKWADCPNNKVNKDKPGASIKKAAKKGEAASTET